MRTNFDRLRGRAYGQVLRKLPRVSGFCKCGKHATEYDHPFGYKGENALKVEAVCHGCNMKRMWERGERKHPAKCPQGHPYKRFGSPRRKGKTKICKECARIYSARKRATAHA